MIKNTVLLISLFLASTSAAFSQEQGEPEMEILVANFLGFGQTTYIRKNVKEKWRMAFPTKGREANGYLYLKTHNLNHVVEYVAEFTAREFAENYDFQPPPPAWKTNHIYKTMYTRNRRNNSVLQSDHIHEKFR